MDQVFLFKLTDDTGKILVLRGDHTLAFKSMDAAKRYVESALSLVNLTWIDEGPGWAEAQFVGVYRSNMIYIRIYTSQVRK